MAADADPRSPAEHVEIRCLCGKVHKFARKKVLERLGRERWRCAACKRRFVVACTPGTDRHRESFWPIFLESVPSRGDTQEMGLATDGAASSSVPDELQFECRCGCRLVGEARIFGRRTRCPKCDARLIVRVGYQSESGKPVALLEYVEDDRAKS